METSPSRVIAPSLLLFAILYGGMVPLGGFLGAKQVALGPLAVEAGIFPFLTLIAISSGIAELHGRVLELAGPGHVDGGDVLRLADSVIIGLSDRTDRAGAETAYARCPGMEGVSMAVYNRLIRAAAFRVITL